MSDMERIKAGDLLPEGSVCVERYARQPDWQIWRTDRGYALAVLPERLALWLESGQVEPGLFLPLTESVFVAETRNYEMLSSAAFGPFPRTAAQTLEIARCFMRTRQANPGAGLAQAFYLPQLPCLLTQGGACDAERDPWTLGFWLTGGMNAPFTDRKRMLCWVPGLTEELYGQIMEELGWTETAPERIQEAPPQQAQIVPAATERRQRDKTKPFELHGRERLERFFREQIIDVIDREEAYRRMGISFPGPTMLVGPPGCGKTFAVQKLAEYLGWPEFTIDSSTIASSYLHETSRLISELFARAVASAPSIVIMDEMEAWLSTRGGMGNMGQAHSEEIAEFLRALPTLAEKKVLLFAMTNMPEQIDPAIRRKGRFDHTLQVDMPSAVELEDLLAHLLDGIPTAKDLDLAREARRLEGRPISDVVFMVREAGRLAVVHEKDRIDQALMQMAWEALNGESEATGKHKSIGFR